MSLGSSLYHARKKSGLTQEAVAEKLGDTGRILVRESGTEPVVRVMVEAGEEALCEKYVDEVIDVIVKKGYRED